MAQQTAVEWLHIEFQKRFPKETYEMYNNNQLSYEQMIEQAKQMEKGGKKLFFDCGRQYQLTGEGTFNQIYNETYGGGESNVLGEVECYFIPSTNTSSGTICRNCGQEMFLHTFGEGIKVSTSPNPQNK